MHNVDVCMFHLKTQLVLTSCRLLKEVIFGIGVKNHGPWKQNAKVSPSSSEILYISSSVRWES